MANTTLSSIGGVIQGNWEDEEIVACIGDGAIKAGMLVSVLATGIIQPVHPDTNDEDEFLGIALESHLSDMDTAPASGEVMNVVIPQSGHLYGVKFTSGTILVGEPVQIDEDQDGTLEVAGNIEEMHMGRVFKGTSTDTFIIIIWGV